MNTGVPPSLPGAGHDARSVLASSGVNGPEGSGPPTFSVVVPVYDEAPNLAELHRRLRTVMASIGEPWELLLVDDGSTDGSAALVTELAAADPVVRPILLVRNFGHQIAVTAGLDRARGDAVVVLDADLQDPPEVIPELVERWREGAEIVVGVRTERPGESRFKRATASVFYRLIRRLTDVDIPLDAGDFRLLDRQVVDAIGAMRERNRFLRGLSAWTGYRTATVPYRRAPRHAGTTKYPLRSMLRFAASAITSFSHVPLQLATLVGFVAAALSALAIPLVVVLRLVGVKGLGGQTTVLIAVLFLGGVQLLSLGVLGEYVGRLYDEAKGRPLYLVRGDPTSRAGGRSAAVGSGHARTQR